LFLQTLIISITKGGKWSSSKSRTANINYGANRQENYSSRNEVDEIKRTPNNQMDSPSELEDLLGNKSMTNKISIQETSNKKVTKESSESKEVNINQTNSSAEEAGSDCKHLTDINTGKQELSDSIFYCEK
jgi:hypothetical protein